MDDADHRTYQSCRSRPSIPRVKWAQVINSNTEEINLSWLNSSALSCDALRSLYHYTVSQESPLVKGSSSFTFFLPSSMTPWHVSSLLQWMLSSSRSDSNADARRIARNWVLNSSSQSRETRTPRYTPGRIGILPRSRHSATLYLLQGRRYG